MKMLHKEMERMNENIYATCLEVFHSVKIRYVPKQICYEQDKTVAGLSPALDFNHNVNRSHVWKYFTQLISDMFQNKYFMSKTKR